MPDEQPRARVLIVGGDSLTLYVCDELMEIESQEVTILWPEAEEAFVARVARCGARFERGRPNDEEMLRRAGVREAFSIMLLSDDDHLNLETALKARTINPEIRLVMRQFNRTLGAKIEAKLSNCSVISLAAQSAATYASVAVDRACFYGVQFPDFTGPLFGFAERSAASYGLDGMTIDEAEQHLHERIIAVDDDIVEDRGKTLLGGNTIATFGPVRPEGRGRAASGPARRWSGPLLPRLLQRSYRVMSRSSPLVRRVAISAFVVFTVASIYFSRTLAIDPLTAAYFVMATMTTTGYGDIVPHSTDHAEQVASMLTMGAGVVFTAIFVAVLTSRFTQAQWTSQQGLRKIGRRGHFIVCGAGNVGTRVIDFLIALGQRVVVIEAKPRSSIVERSRDREFDLLTGDATAATTLSLCALEDAEALIALTESDTMNLEVALGAGEINSRLPVILRMREQTFARSIAQHFDLKQSFSTSGLAAPVFAGLARAPGVRGFVTIAGREFGVLEPDAGDVDAPPVRPIPLVVWRDGAPVLIADPDDVRREERALMLFPTYQFRKSRGTAPSSVSHAGFAEREESNVPL